MQIKQFYTPGLSIYSYLLIDGESKKGVLVDPTRQIELYLDYSLHEGIQITDILETHVHADFISGAPELKKALRGQAIIHSSDMGGAEWVPSYADKVVKDRDILQIGKMRLEAYHTPGHTQEHLIWLAFDERRNVSVPLLVLTGDLLLVGSVGRSDLLGDDKEEKLAKQLYSSLFSIIHSFPDFVEIYPAHGAGSPCGKEIIERNFSTIGYEKRSNPWFFPQEFKKWHAQFIKDMPIPPQYFTRMKQINIKGLRETKPSGSLPIFLSQEEVIQSENALVIDISNIESFASEHIKDSINIPFSPHFSLWAGGVISENSEIIIVAEKIDEAHAAIQSLKLIGLDNITGVSLRSSWKRENDKKLILNSFLITAEDLSHRLNDFSVVDVRTSSEWQSGHIENAQHLELALWPNVIDEISSKKPMAVMCRSGNRASIVTSLLRNAGYEAFNVKGGIQAWSKTGLPLIN